MRRQALRNLVITLACFLAGTVPALIILPSVETLEFCAFVFLVATGAECLREMICGLV